MKRKILSAVLVAAVMGTANPVYAQTQDIYYYYYYENGQIVGEGRDRCWKFGVVPHGEMEWGYATNEFDAVVVGLCQVPWEPIEP